MGDCKHRFYVGFELEQFSLWCQESQSGQPEAAALSQVWKGLEALTQALPHPSPGPWGREHSFSESHFSPLENESNSNHFLISVVLDAHMHGMWSTQCLTHRGHCSLLK